MDVRSRSKMAFFLAILCATFLQVTAEEPHREIASLIRQAGNADDDSVRLRLLRQLQGQPGIDAQLKAEADRFVAAIEKWLDAGNLTYFGGEVDRTIDFDFHIPKVSPLYPLTCLYRGRMLVWTTLENGNIIRYEERRRAFLDKAVANFQAARAAFPENRIVHMYLGEPIPSEKQYAAPDGTPEWARWQRENLERLTDIIVWWIDHRMQPDGQYGGGWGDDCEMWRWWAPVLVGFDDPKITAAQARFSEALLRQTHMRGGYTSRMTDVEHTAEDSSDAITPMMYLEPENPAWKARAVRLAELMENLWTGNNERGFLQFKSTYFTVDRVDDQSQRACDTVYHPRAIQPALLLWQRTGDKKLGALFTRWLDTWVDATARAERGKPAGIVPSAIHWPDGRIGGIGDNWWDPRNHGEPTLYEWPSALPMLNDTLLLAYHMTGNSNYVQPLRTMASIRLKYLKDPPASTPLPGSEAWCAGKLGFLANTLAKYRALTGSHEFDELLARDYHGPSFPLTDAGRPALVERLRHSAEAMRIDFPGYTSEVRWTDRVLRFPALFGENMMFRRAVPGISSPSPELLYSLVTGDPGAGGYCSMSAVRWRTSPRDFAAMVTDTGSDRFAAELFHFGSRQRLVSADLYLLAPASYTLSVSSVQGNGQKLMQLVHRPLKVSGAVTRIDLEIPIGQTIQLRLARQTEN